MADHFDKSIDYFTSASVYWISYKIDVPQHVYNTVTVASFA